MLDELVLVVLVVAPPEEVVEPEVLPVVPVELEELLLPELPEVIPAAA